MGNKRRDKQQVVGAVDAGAPGPQGPKGRGRDRDRPAGPAAPPAFRLPEPSRTAHVRVPAVLPPALEPEGAAAAAAGGLPEEVREEEGEEGASASACRLQAEALAALPRKLPLQLLPLLSHPVTINAIRNFLTEDECRSWIEWGELRGFEEAKQKQNSVYAHRDNGRIEFDHPDIAYQIWLRMRPFVPDTVGKPPRQALGCSSRIRVYRYVRGQRFGQHVDGSRDEPSMGGRTHFTVLVYLNGGDAEPVVRRVRGGETVFWKDHDGKRPALAFPPTRGVCLFHGHGDECMTHEGAGVEEGVKYVLRTDVVYALEPEPA